MGKSIRNGACKVTVQDVQIHRGERERERVVSSSTSRGIKTSREEKRGKKEEENFPNYDRTDYEKFVEKSACACVIRN